MKLFMDMKVERVSPKADTVIALELLKWCGNERVIKIGYFCKNLARGIHFISQGANRFRTEN